MKNKITPNINFMLKTAKEYIDGTDHITDTGRKFGLRYSEESNSYILSKVLCSYQAQYDIIESIGRL